MKLIFNRVFSFLFFLICVSAGSKENKYVSPTDELRTAYEKWNHITEVLQKVVLQGYPSIASEQFEIPSISVFDLVELQRNGNNSSLTSLKSDTTKCEHDIIYVLENIKTLWVLQLIDSYGKPSSGILKGGFTWPGSYDECVQIYAPPKANSTIGNFHGKYCTLSWTLQLPSENKSSEFPMSTGICIPETCSSNDLTDDFGKLLHFAGITPIINKIGSIVNITKISCKPTSRELNTPAIAMICFLSFFGVMVLFGSSITVYEYFQNSRSKVYPHQSFNNDDYDDPELIKVNEESTAKKKVGSKTDDDILLLGTSTASCHTSTFDKTKPFLKSFCIFTNGSKILNTDASEGQLLCIHGIRFLSMTWVILGHTYAFSFSTLSNIVETLSLIDNVAFQIVLQGFYSVDSFFLLSGFLVTYLFLKEITKRDGKISWLYFYLHRYIRLTPVYMVVIGFYTTLVKYLGSGPYWPDGDIDDVCKDNWWMNLLYINNFVKAENSCLGWSWYLANDMQFYVISPLFLYALWRWPKIGFSVIGVLMCSCWISSWVITYDYNLFPGISTISTNVDMTNFMKTFADYFEKLYIKPYARISPYLVGVILGYILFHTKDRRSPRFAELLIGWVLASALTLTVIYGLYHANPSLWVSSTYNAFNRTCFSIGLAWVIYVCLSGSGGFVNNILSYKFFIPLSRLTYCAYLVHPIIITGYFQLLKSPINFSHPTMVTLFLGLLVVSYGFAFLTTLFFESPIMGLEKVIMKKFSKA